MKGESELIKLPPDVTGSKEDIDKALELFNMSILESFVEGDSGDSPVMAIIKGNNRVGIFVMEDVYTTDASNGEGNLSNPKMMQKLHEAAVSMDGHVELLAISGESVIAKKDGTGGRGVFLASQDVHGKTTAHIYIQNSPDDTSGHFSESDDMSSVAHRAARKVVGKLWGEYLLTKALNS